MNLSLLVFGAYAVIYGLIGERIPGKIIQITDTNSNSISRVERIVWIAVGLCAFAAGFSQFYARYKRA